MKTWEEIRSECVSEEPGWYLHLNPTYLACCITGALQYHHAIGMQTGDKERCREAAAEAAFCMLCMVDILCLNVEEVLEIDPVLPSESEMSIHTGRMCHSCHMMAHEELNPHLKIVENSLIELRSILSSLYGEEQLLEMVNEYWESIRDGRRRL